MEKNKLVQTITEELLSKLGVAAHVTVTDSSDEYNVQLDSEDNALLIGKHGNTLSSLEYILALMVAAKSGEYKRMIIEVGGYRAERENYLKDLAERLKQEVISTGDEKRISGLKSWERRLIHMLLAESEVMTESEGDGRDRVLVIKKK